LNGFSDGFRYGFWTFRAFLARCSGWFGEMGYGLALVFAVVRGLCRGGPGDKGLGTGQGAADICAGLVAGSRLRHATYPATVELFGIP
jgi:hypothetical protein